MSIFAYWTRIRIGKKTMWKRFSLYDFLNNQIEIAPFKCHQADKLHYKYGMWWGTNKCKKHLQNDWNENDYWCSHSYASIVQTIHINLFTRRNNSPSHYNSMAFNGWMLFCLAVDFEVAEEIFIALIHGMGNKIG